VAGDLQYASLGFLLHGDGSDGSTTITDSGPAARAVTALGNAQIDTAQSQFGGASILFDGSGDGLSISDAAATRPGSGDFTLEFFQRYNSKTGYQTIYSKGYAVPGAIVIQTGNGDGLLNVYQGASSTLVCSESGTINTGQWYFVQIRRSGSTLEIYRDGVLTASGSSTTNFNSTAVTYIGGGSSTGFNNYYYNGHLDEIRLTVGVARETTVPVAAFEDHIACAASSVDPTTTFGSPDAAWDQVGVAGSIDVGTQFGTPQLLDVWVDATSLGPVATFGEPIAGFDQACDADPTGPVVQFGTPAVLQICVASSIAPGTQVPLAFYAFNQTLDASGFSLTKVGAPVALRYLPADTSQICDAASIAAGPSFGFPTALPVTACPVTSLGQVAQFGTPAATDTGRTLEATELSPGTQVPTPVVRITQDASATGSTLTFGTPSVLCTAHATSLQLTQRWGTAVATRENSYEVYSGINLGGRFGQPTALQRFNYPATSLNPVAQFGTPVMVQRHRVTSIAPVTQFGDPVRRFIPAASSVAPGTTFGTPGVAP